MRMIFGIIYDFSIKFSHYYGDYICYFFCNEGRVVNKH